MNKRNLLYIAICLWVFIFAFNSPLDLDQGWHLRYGQYFWGTGHVLKDNILSFVWPDYKWVQASWGYDLLLYQIFIHFGFLGISLGGAIFTTAIFLLITWPVKRFKPFALFILAAIFLAMTAPLYSTGMRSQTPSTLFFALVIMIAYFQNRTIYFLPLIFLIWANLHGGFSLGLILLLIIWFIQGFLLLVKKMKKASFELISTKQWFFFGLMILLSTLTPLINPWGLRIYEETLKHSSNINLTIITEWMPLTQDVAATIVVSLILIFTLLTGFIRRRISDLPFLIALLATTYLAFSALRFIIPFGVMVVFYLSQTILKIKLNPINKYFSYALRTGFIAIILIDLFITQKFYIPPNPQVLSFNWNSYCRIQGECSEEITKLMLQNPPKGNGYHPYNYGGYLSWRVPMVKTFIDGRMAAWEDDKGNTPPVVDGDRVVHEKNPFTFRRFDSQYHFKWVIVYAYTPITKYLDQLSQDGLWKKVYADNYFNYYVKN